MWTDFLLYQVCFLSAACILSCDEGFQYPPLFSNDLSATATGCCVLFAFSGPMTLSGVAFCKLKGCR